MSNLTHTCCLGFDCKSMTGFISDDCPNLHVCASSVRRTPNDQVAPRESVPFYIDKRNNALTVDCFLSPTAREAGWHVASRLPYKYENSCLTVDSNKYYYEINEATRIELTQTGWLPPQSLPWQIIDDEFKVVENLTDAGWAKAELLPYLKTEDGLVVGDIYYYDCVQLGWAKACDLVAIYGLVIFESYCPDCGSSKVMSVVFERHKDYYKSYYHCPNCLWSASIIPSWIEQQYFL